MKLSALSEAPAARAHALAGGHPLMQGATVVSAAQAGFLSGGFVAGLFFVGDLVRLAPLSTPAALMWKLSLRELPLDGGGSSLDLAAASDIASWASLGGGLAALTTLLLLTFALLAVAAVACFEWLHLPMNALTGAAWGLVVYSLVFELGMAAVHPGLVEDVPGFWSVACANLLAGAIMGGYLQLKAAGEKPGA